MLNWLSKYVSTLVEFPRNQIMFGRQLSVVSRQTYLEPSSMFSPPEGILH